MVHIVIEVPENLKPGRKIRPFWHPNLISKNGMYHNQTWILVTKTWKPGGKPDSSLDLWTEPDFCYPNHRYQPPTSNYILTAAKFYGSFFLEDVLTYTYETISNTNEWISYTWFLIGKSSLDLSHFSHSGQNGSARWRHKIMTVKKVTASAKTSRNEFGEKMYYGNLSVLCSMY